MVDADALKQQVCAAIDDNREAIIDLAKSVEAEPELGFKETKTTRKVAEAFESMGLSVEEELAVTGARARLGSGEMRAAVFGELDALVNPDHPKANPETGAVHACGHHAQLAHLVGVASGFTGAGVVDELDAAIDFVGVPAEEYLDLSYRRELIESGQTEFVGGKQELIRRGHLDDVDLGIMMHAGNDAPERVVTSDFSTNGFVGKFVTYRGREAHAGAAPEEGVNALNAAMLGMNAIHAQRERFADEDAVRVHPIITKGGDGVNVVPADVQMESYVRAKSVDAVREANVAVNRALESGAMGVGADVEINDYPGYMPLRTDPTIVGAYDDNVRDLVGTDALGPSGTHLTGSTDMGDVTQILPGIHPWVGGFEGSLHARDFRVVDEEMAYILPAKLTACTLVDVLASEERRQSILAAKAAKKDTETYLDEVRSFRGDVEASYLD
ncbi:amidohydrolase [Halogranum rubrum]|uniref:Peptidase M20 domain-containing protein 2 n=1 Tax=Halogranum rubrum TaxID=553466 RepID=A0A1I4E9H4_9EURY|nr:amidohydrolase [Halogranum rubrum]SFL01016.1 amidohydrolase [Halogranum rubrum]